jgi:hypothetical protein
VCQPGLSDRHRRQCEAAQVALLTEILSARAHQRVQSCLVAAGAAVV